MYFKSQTANRARFQVPTPAISHFVRFGFNPEKIEKVLNSSNRCVLDCESFRKKNYHLHKQHKGKMLKYFSLPFISRCFFYDKT